MKKKTLAAIIILVGLVLPIYAAADDVSGNAGETGSMVSSGDFSVQDYYDILLAEKAGQQQYNIYKNQLQAQLLELKLTYLSELEKEWAQKCGAEEKKLEMGYTIPVAVKEAEGQHAAVLLEIESVREKQEFYMEAIALYGGVYQEVIVSEECGPLTDDYTELFLEGSAQRLYYEQQILGYEAALLNAVGNAEEINVLQKQLQLAMIEKTQYEINMELYVKELQLQYRDIERKIADKDNKITVAEMKVNNAALLYEKGKISELELTELKNELHRLQYERAELLYEAKDICYRLNHGIKE